MEKSLKDLISKLPIPGLKESTNRHIIAEVLSKKLKIPIQAKQIKFKDNTLSVSVPPIVKSTLQIHQENLKELLSSEGIIITCIR